MEVTTHNDAARQLLRHTPVKHSGWVETSCIWQSVAESVHFASHHVVVVTLVYSCHCRTNRPIAYRWLSFAEKWIGLKTALLADAGFSQWGGFIQAGLGHGRSGLKAPRSLRPALGSSVHLSSVPSFSSLLPFISTLRLPSLLLLFHVFPLNPAIWRAPSAPQQVRTESGRQTHLVTFEVKKCAFYGTKHTNLHSPKRIVTSKRQTQLYMPWYNVRI